MKLYKQKLIELSKQGYNAYTTIYLRTNVKFDFEDKLIPIEFDNKNFFWCNNKKGSAPYILIPSINNGGEIDSWGKSADFETVLTYLGLLNFYISQTVSDIYIEIDYDYYRGYSSLCLFNINYYNDLLENCRSIKLRKDLLVEFEKNGKIKKEDLIVLSFFREAQSLMKVNKFYAFLSFFKILDFYFIRDKRDNKNAEMIEWVNKEWSIINFRDILQFFSIEEKNNFDIELKNYKENSSVGEYFVYIRDNISHTLLSNSKYFTKQGFYPYIEKDFNRIKHTLPAIKIIIWKLLSTDKFLNFPIKPKEIK